MHANTCSDIHLLLPKSGEEAKQPTLEKKKKQRKQQRRKQFRCTKRLTLGERKAKNRRTVRSYNVLRDLLPTLAPLNKRGINKKQWTTDSYVPCHCCESPLRRLVPPIPSHPIPFPARAKQASSRLTGKSRWHTTDRAIKD